MNPETMFATESDESKHFTQPVGCVGAATHRNVTDGVAPCDAAPARYRHGASGSASTHPTMCRAFRVLPRLKRRFWLQ